MNSISEIYRKILHFADGSDINSNGDGAGINLWCDNVEEEDSKTECDMIVNMLFDTAQVNCGFMLEEPSDYATKINKMIEEKFC